jgi:hypothetical protein
LNEDNVDKSKTIQRKGARFITGLTLLLASTMPLTSFAADEAAPSAALATVHKGIPHDAL